METLEIGIFYFTEPHRNVIFSIFLGFLVFISPASYTTKHWSKRGAALSQTVNLHQQHLKFLVAEVFKDTFQWYSKLEVKPRVYVIFLYKEIPHNLKRVQVLSLPPAR